MPNEDDRDDCGFDFDFDCCEIPKAVEARTVETRCDRRAFSRRNLRAGEVILRNLPTAHTLLREHRKERCARCLTTSRREETSQQQQQQQPSQQKRKNNLLRCGGCKQIWYCSRDCQKEDFFFHKVECKESSILLPSGQQDNSSGSGGTINNASLLVRNFLALRVPQSRDKTNNNNSTNKCRLHGDSTIVHCGSDHFDNLIEYGNDHPLDSQEKLDIQRASRALWNQRKAINKQTKTNHHPPSDNSIIHSRSDLEDQLEGDMRRFRANNFGVTDSMVRVVASAAYPLGALLNHSCAPNCLLRYGFSGSSTSSSLGGAGRRSHEPPVMEIVAARDIPKREELTHSYVELVSPMQSRRASLREIFGFDCHCTGCSSSSEFQISLPHNHGSLSPIQLSRWVLQNYNPSNPKFGRDDDSSLASVDQEMILQQPTLNNNTNYMALVEAANAKQQQAQYFMATGDLDGELGSLKEAVDMFESSLAQASNVDAGNLPLSLDLYKARCTRFGSLIVAGGEIYAKEALIECEHIVSFLCLALKHVPNHSLLGLQLFTLGDVYEANGERDKAHSTYTWARRILRISQGNKSDMVMLLNEKIR
jgi:hypothetical protein